MVTTEQKLVIVEAAIAYWEERPDRWVKWTIGDSSTGMCLGGNITWHSRIVQPRYRDEIAQAMLRDTRSAIERLVSPACPIISYYNDYVCQSVTDALRPLYMIRDAYRTELAPVAVTPHEYHLV